MDSNLWLKDVDFEDPEYKLALLIFWGGRIWHVIVSQTQFKIENFDFNNNCIIPYLNRKVGVKAMF